MAISGTTVLYGIIGNPVTHSLSPAMHNAALAALGIDAVYLPFPASDIAAAVTGIRGLGIQGLSVTIPHKESVMALLDTVDPVAVKIGAVNTIVNTEKVLTGLNTDWLGATRALEEEIDLSGAHAVILGAGGSARAIGFGLLEKGASITLCSRTESRGRRLADELHCPWISLEESDRLRGDVLINATSVGMVPQIENTPVSEEVTSQFQVVMDIVYAPMKTRLLREAEAGGCKIINGLEMLLYQGVAQFEIWTGKDAPVSVMRKALVEVLARKK
ncbi:shikimate dehydrogenase [Desulfocapsa sulfexigens DSM 10523]|uniref:Shikimate dehydrogenase (NADP(+)) n=1 Tax=Desulfocapsa sulfexigens (strain DSM 10523 / SB164P1) TaxID=1167006 RepID=M1PJX6_DESSD|nr:shikimate dehydrogenase [Desulfocapsa sulfexigens]AGF76816.1 shikimate dehydrogenase [Desulfocapsa sulfexigens DSM 10523]